MLFVQKDMKLIFVFAFHPLSSQIQTFGIMTALSSYCPHGEPVVVNSFVVAIANSTFSFISGELLTSQGGESKYLILMQNHNSLRFL